MGLLGRAANHVASGGFVVLVPADEEQKAGAAEILASHGGHDMMHYGKGHWERLGS